MNLFFSLSLLLVHPLFYLYLRRNIPRKYYDVDQVFGVERCDEFESNCDTLWYMTRIQIKLTKLNILRIHDRLWAIVCVCTQMTKSKPLQCIRKYTTHYSQIYSANTYETCVHTANIPNVYKQNRYARYKYKVRVAL